ncbi:Rha family transcriptional regulator [Accumulibacter sp.]|uniref:Rha family transcriptional regulator n=1 Tax=Accumulibacter sp. TaxID=2053492 RepID=UPI0026302B6D|nr:Rha family transcriptional regulator [Accumulibacter sp.]
MKTLHPDLFPESRLFSRDGDRVFTTSLKVAEHFHKQHCHVLRAIRDIRPQVPEEFMLLNFEESSYTDEQGKFRRMLEMTRDGFTLLAMGFTGLTAMPFNLAYIERFNAMEAQWHHRRTIGIAIPPVLTLAGYLETRDSLSDLRAELSVLDKRLAEAEIHCQPADIEAMTKPRLQGHHDRSEGEVHSPATIRALTAVK